MFSTFPFSRLPEDVLFLVSEYLSPKDRAQLSKTSKFYRRFFESPSLWRNTTVCIKSTKLKTNVAVLKSIQKRKVKSVEFHVFDVELFKFIAVSLPWLENLSLQKMPSEGEMIIRALHSFSACENLCNLSIRGRSYHAMVSDERELSAVFANLKSLTLTECSLTLDPPVQRPTSVMKMLIDSLSSLGGLESITLAYCVGVRVDLVKAVLRKCNDLHSLKLGNTQFGGNDGVFQIGERPKLKVLELSGRSDVLLKWINLKNFPNLKELSLSSTQSSEKIKKIQNISTLEKLDLSNSCLQNSDIKDWSLPCLRHLELRGCFQLDKSGISLLSMYVGTTLEYLGLANCRRIQTCNLYSLPLDFPKLRSFNFSGTSVISAEFLQYWYKGNKVHEWPLKHLILKGRGFRREFIYTVQKQLGCNLIVEI